MPAALVSGKDDAYWTLAQEMRTVAVLVCCCDLLTRRRFLEWYPPPRGGPRIVGATCRKSPLAGIREGNRTT